MPEALRVAKAQAYGNDFLYVERPTADSRDWMAVAKALCDRHAGVGADGLIVFERGAQRPRMELFNSDGSRAEISGNGVRGLAALLRWRDRRAGPAAAREFVIDTDAGPKSLTLLSETDAMFTFRAAMGEPVDIRQRALDVDGEMVTVVSLRVGNPQCVVLETELNESRYRRLGPRLERHAAFPDRTNVSFAKVASPDRVQVLIWERGVGPTSASGTGACGAAVAAMSYGGCNRDVEVVSPGGAQRVAWDSQGIHLTGSATVVWQGEWFG